MSNGHTAADTAIALRNTIGANKWVSTATVMDIYGPAMTVDALTEVLAFIAFERNVDIVSEDNRKALTARELAAAIRIGGRDIHMIRVR